MQTPFQPPSHGALKQKQRPKNSGGSTTATSLECSVCGRCFSRPSHHDRHYRTHLPPEGRLSLPCNRCDKTFGRKDVLLRHLRMSHGVDPGPQPKAAQKSCYRCVQLRRKCDRQQPCSLCAAVGVRCQYPGKLAASSTPGPEVKHSPVAGISLHDLPHHQQHLPSYQQLPQHFPETSHAQKADSMPMALGYTTPESAASQNRTPPVATHDGMPAQQQLFHSGLPSAYPGHSQPQAQPLSQPQLLPRERHSEYDTTMSIDSLSIPGSSQPPLGQGSAVHDAYLNTSGSHGVPSVPSVSAHSVPPASGASPPFSDEYYLAPDTSTFAGSLSAAGQLDFRGTGLDWLAFDVPETYTSADGGLPGIDSVMVTQAPLQHIPQQATPLATQLPPQSHPRYTTDHASQQPSYQLERSLSSHYSPYPTAPAVSHGLPGYLQHASPRPQTASAPYSSFSHPSYPPPPTYSHTSQQNGHTASVQPPPNPVLPWSFEEGPHEQQPQRYSLPPLREVLQNTLLQSTNPTPSDKSVLANLVVLLSDTRIPGAPDADDARHGNPDDARKTLSSGVDDGPTSHPAPMPLDPGMAYATSLLKQLVDTYITKFQPILPLLHLPTWDIATAPRVLVSAMACVGSLLSDDDRTNGLTLSISDICMPMIAWMGSSDSANYRDISYLSALCVHQIYSLGSGNRQLYQNADRSRGILVGGLRGMGCLTTRLSLEDQAEQAAHASFVHGMCQQYQSGGPGTAPPTPTTGDPPPLTTALQEQWLSWMYREREKRTAWSSFEYDCSLCTLTSRRGAVDLSELPSRLPCAETLWEAPSATAWAALRTRLHLDAQGALLSVVVRGALRDDTTDTSSENSSLLSLPSSTGTPNLHTKSHSVSFWGKRLCAQVIGRLLWDLKQLETLATSQYFGMPSLSTAHAANKVRLLRALDSLLVSMDQPTTVADLISYKYVLPLLFVLYMTY